MKFHSLSIIKVAFPIIAQIRNSFEVSAKKTTTTLRKVKNKIIKFEMELEKLFFNLIISTPDKLVILFFIF